MEFMSLWFAGMIKKSYPKLKRNIAVDVLIVGGGITGLSTAYFLKKSGLKVALVERDLLAHGASGRNTGKINYLQETIYSDLTRMYSFSVAQQYLYSQDFGISLLRNIILDEEIKCDLQKVISYVFTEDEDEILKIKKEKEVLEKFGLDVKEYTNIQGKIGCKYMIGVDNTYTFHPVKYLYRLAEICKKNKTSIYEKTKIVQMKKKGSGYVCKTEDGFFIRCDKLVLACHFPSFFKPYFFPLKVTTEKSYLTASVVKKIKNETYITNTYPCKSLRFYKDKKKYLLYVGQSHIICNALNEKKNYKKMLKECDVLDIDPSNYWCNDDLMTIDGMPYIGRIEKNNSHLLIGTGYNTWGMTNGTLAGYCLSQMIRGEECEYEKIFDPLRVNRFCNLDKLFMNVGYNMKGYVENKIIKNKYWYPSSISYEVRDNKEVAVYHDGKKEYVVYTKCPHMGCTLLFNEIDKTWDCPCHASRFNLEGKSIKGPSSYDICCSCEKLEEEL